MHEPPRYEVRPARRDDGPAILAINRQGVPGVSLLGMPEVEEFLRRSRFFRVAEQAGVVVAYLIGLSFDLPYEGEEFLWFKTRFRDFLYVDQVAVAGESRGRGAASALYADLERSAVAQQTPLLTLEVNLRPENRPSLAFHERQGFAEVGRLETRDGRLVRLMAKWLDSPGRS